MTHFKTSENSLILIVVNTANTLGVLFDYLRGFGFRVMVAGDGESAVDHRPRQRCQSSALWYRCADNTSQLEAGD